MATFRLLSLLALACLFAGCGPIFSRQDYGSPTQRTVGEGSSLQAVYANMGMPDEVVDINENTTVLAYRVARGSTILGVVGQADRTDTIVIVQNGAVTYIGEVPVGRGLSVLPAWPLGGTTPFTVETLMDVNGTEPD